jgi:CheY-like chemotaxis protein
MAGYRELHIEMAILANVRPRFSMMNIATQQLPRAATGIAGLHDILAGGLARDRLHLLEGNPGTGKTTIALQFLLTGAQAGELGIYVSLAETEQELRDGARSHGWTIGDEIKVFELVAAESVLDANQHQSLLYSSDLELGETIQRILKRNRAPCAKARGDRQPFGDSSAGAELVALSPPDSRAQALLRAKQLDRDHARRLDDGDHGSGRSQHRAPHAELPSVAAAAAIHGSTILLIDDDHQVREVTRAMLHDLGYRVLEAGSGGAALDLIDRETEVDLVVVDFAMPGMNGAELARLVRAKRPGLPVLFITGFADRTALAGISEASIISKPFVGDELSRKVGLTLAESTSTNVVRLRR